MSSINHFVKSNSLITRFKIHALRLALFLLVAALGTLFTLGTVSAVRAAAGNIPLFAPSISVQKADAFVGGDGDGKADPGETIRYTTTISNSGTDATGVAFNDTIDSNTTLQGSAATSPVAISDTLPVTVTGNIGINTALMTTPFSVVTNDYQGKNMSPALAILGPATFLSAQGGNVTMTLSGAGIGHFTYDPPAGFEGVDTFTYTLNDNTNAPIAPSNRTATVSITVSDMIWFVNNNAALACTTDGCGTLLNPYSTLAAFNSANDGTDILFSHHPAANDNIFVYESATPYTGGITLLSGQKLIGQDSTQTLSAITGISPVTGSSALPSMNTIAPATVIQNASGNGVTLNSGNTLNGFTASNSSGSSISGSGFGTLTVADVIVNTNGQALSLTNGTLSATFPSITSTGGTNNIVLAKGAGSLSGTLTISGGALSGATGNAFDLNGGTATISDAGTIASGNARSINVTGLTSGTVTFSGAITDTDTGINLTTNTGATINFTGGMALSTGTNTAFNATGSGTVNVAQNNTSIVNTLTTTTGTALNVANVTIGASDLTFRSISSNGAASGIVLNTTGSSGGLVVVGNGSASSGGTIQNTSNHGISLNSTQDVSLTLMNIQTTGGSGINGTSVTNFTFTNGTIAGAGNAGQESAIAFNGSGSLVGNNIAGTLTVTGNTFTNPFYSGVDVQSDNGTISNATVSNNIITNPGSSGINFVGTGNASTVFNLTKATINQNNISGSGGNGIQINIGNSGTGPGATAGAGGANLVSITNNAITLDPTGTNAIVISNSTGNAANRAKTNFIVQCNGSNTGGCTSPNNAGVGSSNIGTVILIGNNGSSDMTGLVDSNKVVATHTVGGGGGNGIAGGNGVTLATGTETPHLVLTVTNNTVTGTDGNGILLVGRGTSGLAELGIRNNNVAAPLSGVRPGIRVDAGNASSVDDAVCLNISGNTTAGSGGHEGIGLRKQGTVSTTNDFGVEGMSATSSTGIELFVGNTGQNPGSANGSFGTTGVLLISATSGFSNCSTVALQPNNNKTVAQAQTQVREAAAGLGAAKAVTTASLSGKASKQSVWAKASNVALLSGTINTGNDQLVSVKLPAPAQSGETIPQINIGTLPAGKSVKVVYDVMVDNPLPQSATKILNQSVITGSNFSVVNSTNGGTVDCETDTKTCTPIDLIDLSVSKVNNTSGTVVLGNLFTWTVQVSNGVGLRDAIFNSGDVVLEDHLPSGATYATPSVAASGGVTGLPDCSITSNVLTCTAPVGGLTIPGGEAVAIAFDTTPTTGPASLVNPTGGVCKVDPNALFAEVSTANNSCSDTVTVTRPNTTVTSLTRQSANPNKNASVTWQIVFADPVDGLTASNFSVVYGGSVAGAVLSAPTEMSGPPSTIWNISATTYTGDGTLELRFANDTGLSHAVTNAPYTQPSNGAVYTIDRTAPLVSSIVRQSPAGNPTNADALVFRVTFNEAVTGVGANSFVDTGTTTPISSSVSSVTPNLVYDFTIDSIADGGNLASLNGTVGLNVAASPTITDLAGNTLQVVEPTPAASNDQTYTLDNIAPTVTINQAVGQNDPTNGSTANFTAVFSESVGTSFASGDVTRSGSASASTLAVSEIAPFDGTTYNVSVLGISTDGTVIVSILANQVQDLAGNNNTASTSTDNSVTRDTVAPTVTINQAAGQLDPTNASPINFTAVFSEDVGSSFVTGDVSLSGTAGATTGTVTEIAPFDGTTYTVAVSGMTGDGTVIASILANKAQDLAGNNNTAATFTDHTVTYDTTAPTVTINQAAGQSDPTGTSPINFTAVFSEDVGTSFVTGDVTLSGTAGATTGTVTEIAPFDGTTYNIAVSGLAGDGTVIASILANKAQDLAGNNNTAATFTDHTVLYDTVPPSVTINQASGQSDPTSTNPINFTAVFSEGVTGFGDLLSDVTLTGTASATVTSITETAPFDSTTYTVAVTATSNGTVIASIPANKAQDLASQNNTASTSTDHTVTYVPPTDLSITKTDGVTVATPGGSVTYTITASNAGPNDDSAATVADTFPASLTVNWTCVGAGGGSCTASGSGNINDTVNLPAGGSVTYTASAAISASATGSLSNTATVTTSASLVDTTPGNNSATDVDALSPQADLSITKTDGVTTATPGGSVTYTITASNAGPSNAPGTTVADTFPASLTVNWTCVGAGGGTCTASGSGNINDAVNLPAGGSVTYTASATISASATGTLSNTATVTSAVTDPTPGNNSATDSDTLSPQADLAITKTDGATIAVAGGSLTYTITASNSGPSNAPGSTVADTFPASLTVTSWTCVGAGGGTCTASGSGNINDAVNLPAGGSVTYTANANVSIAATGTLSNTATVTGGVTDPVPGNNSATDSDTAVPPVAVTIDQKTSAPAQADPANASPINFTVVFVSSVTGFGNSDVSLSGTAGATTAVVTGGPTTYNVAVSGMTGDGTVIATIAAGVATGSQGEPNAASTSTDNNVTYDGTLPTVSMSSVALNPTNGSPIPVTVQFSETVTGFIASDITTGNGTVNNFVVVDGDTYTFDLTPTANGLVTADIAANKAFDTANNGNTAATQFSRTYDNTAPTAVLSSSTTSPTNTSPIVVTITFSEPVTGVGAGDLSATNAATTIPTGGPTVYTFNLTPTVDGPVTVKYLAGSASDMAGNPNTVDSNTFSITYDTVDPTVTINQKTSAPAQIDPTSLSPINFTVVFSEAVSGFTAADIALSGTANPTTAVITGSGPTYNVAVSGMNASGTVIATVKKSIATDAAGNLNDISTSTDNTVTYDNTPLTVTINQAVGQADPTTVSPIHFTAVFSEGVSGFTGTDISFYGTTLSGTLSATVTQITPTTYDVAVKGMIPKGTVFVRIPAGAATSISRPGVTNQLSTSTDNNVIFDYILAEFTSTAAKDGWLLESAETSGVGGSLNSTSPTLTVGDDASDRQYRSLLDFTTNTLPDNAVIYSANLRIVQASVTGTNPFTTHGFLRSEIKSGFFGVNGLLAIPDFEFAPDAATCNFETVPEILESIGTAYRCIISSAAFPDINRTGSTQLRLRFTTDDNDDMSADMFNFYSGDFVSPSQGPRLFIKYYIPPTP